MKDKMPLPPALKAEFVNRMNAITPAVFSELVMDIIGDVYSGNHTDEHIIPPTVTAGMLAQIRGFHKHDGIMQHITGITAARLTRQIALSLVPAELGQVMLTIYAVEFLQMSEPKVKELIRQLDISKLDQKYGSILDEENADALFKTLGPQPH